MTCERERVDDTSFAVNSIPDQKTSSRWIKHSQRVSSYSLSVASKVHVNVVTAPVVVEKLVEVREKRRPRMAVHLPSQLKLQLAQLHGSSLLPSPPPPPTTSPLILLSAGYICC